MPTVVAAISWRSEQRLSASDRDRECRVMESKGCDLR
jgi:hypothetical protein